MINYPGDILMPIKSIYLTIDDAPSMHMGKKVAFLKKHSIPALFYARGEHIKKYPEQIINAINNGFLIGNHSLSHPSFSTITLQECFDEIVATEQLIDECYAQAQVRRPHKVMRFPFGDRGAGPDGAQAHTERQLIHVQQIQHFLKENNFSQIIFGMHKDSFTDSFIDSLWDWDTQDYKSKHIQNFMLYLERLNAFCDTYTSESAIMLVHDFDGNHQLFELTMQFLMAQNIQFLDYVFLTNNMLPKNHCC